MWAIFYWKERIIRTVDSRAKRTELGGRATFTQAVELNPDQGTNRCAQLNFRIAMEQ